MLQYVNWAQVPRAEMCNLLMPALLQFHDRLAYAVYYVEDSLSRATSEE